MMYNNNGRKSKTVIVGAGGRVGLPLSLVVAQNTEVYGLEIDKSRIDLLNKGIMPFHEDGAQELLYDALRKKSLVFGQDTSELTYADYIVIIIGTPLDNFGIPSVEPLFTFVKDTLLPEWKKRITWDVKNLIIPTVILRSTVIPGTTEKIKALIEENSYLKEGEHFFLVYAPERCAEGKVIQETSELNQIIGCFNLGKYLAYEMWEPRTSAHYAHKFFNSFNKKDILWLSTREAEYAKLMTNMYRYVNFGLANEFYTLAYGQDVDVNKVIDAVNKNYPRANIPKPGYAAGPCLYKDGKFLVTGNEPHSLIEDAFHINQGLPDFVWVQVRDLLPKNRGNKIAILGASFKANSDDARESPANWMRILAGMENDLDTWDPVLYKESHITVEWGKYDAMILMAPHDEFKNMWEFQISKQIKPGTIIADIWKFFPESKATKTGIYQWQKS